MQSRLGGWFTGMRVIPRRNALAYLDLLFQTKTQSESNEDHSGLESTNPAPEDWWVGRGLPQCTMCQPQSVCFTDESPASKKGGRIEVSPNAE